MGTFLIFLVMLAPNTSKPTVVLMHHFEMGKACAEILASLPPGRRDKFACISIDLKPANEGVEL